MPVIKDIYCFLRRLSSQDGFNHMQDNWRRRARRHRDAAEEDWP